MQFNCNYFFYILLTDLIYHILNFVSSTMHDNAKNNIFYNELRSIKIHINSLNNFDRTKKHFTARITLNTPSCLKSTLTETIEHFPRTSQKKKIDNHTQTAFDMQAMPSFACETFFTRTTITHERFSFSPAFFAPVCNRPPAKSSIIHGVYSW